MNETKGTTSNWERTLYCGDLRAADEGRRVTLLGWVQRVRDMGNLLFIDIRDRQGVAQVVFHPDRAELLEEARKARPENVIGIRGSVKARDTKSVNAQMATGAIEVEASEFKLINTSKVPPFVVADQTQASEELRFKYRYLDLRRPVMQHNIKLRHEATLRTRNHLAGQGFYEIETPFLGKSTPEGARDYLVPSRIHKGRFYALPQSPQLFKQMLMMSGFDKYFQIARCFRDEDLRADRQPEFTQIDIEMSFIDPEAVYSLVEGLMVSVFELIGEKVRTPFPRFTWRESMDKYGTDKPDLRAGNEIRDLAEAGPSLGSDIILNALGAGKALKGLAVKGAGGYSRSQIDKLGERAKSLGAPGLFWAKRTGGLKSSFKLPETAADALWKAVGAEADDLVLMIADKAEAALKVLGEIRKEFVAAECRGKKLFAFAWVTDFPLFEWSEEEQRHVAMHHPFTAPAEEDIAYLETDLSRVRAKAYDVVLNGYELGGGSIRIHDMELQKKIFKALRLTPEEAEDKFGFFLEALRHGTPPHGGVALGLDRLVMLLAGEESLREVIPFPKTTSALCLLTGSPSTVDGRQLDELGIRIKD
jgi:aspartyl-tRNA synthetase